jgi:hypothetical protein
VYSDKAPGLAFATLPAYLVIEQTSWAADRNPTRALWGLSLAGAVVPALLLAALVGWVVNRLEPGAGAATAATLALGTLLFPYATVLYAHALSSFLSFAAFAALFAARRLRQRTVFLTGIAGLAAGLAVVVEYPLALVACVLAAYAVVDAPRLGRAASFGAGVLVGVSPLLVYDRWAFGSVTHLSYSSSHFTPAGGELARGFDIPRPHTALDVLFGHIGLLTFAPVLACALAGLVLLYRRSYRAEALVAAAVFALDIVYVSGYFTPFGGLSAGPRYLIPALAFAALGLGSAYRAWPGVTLGLAAASVAIFTVVTATHPIAAYDLHVVDRLTSGGFAQSFMQLQPRIGSLEIVPFFVAAAVGFACGVAVSRVRLTRRPAAAGIAAAVSWGLVAKVTPELVDERTALSDLLVVLVVVVAVAAVVAIAAGPWPRRMETTRAV